MHSERRIFLAHCARLLSLTALAAAFPGCAVSRVSSYPFSLGRRLRFAACNQRGVVDTRAARSAECPIGRHATVRPALGGGGG